MIRRSTAFCWLCSSLPASWWTFVGSNGDTYFFGLCASHSPDSPDDPRFNRLNGPYRRDDVEVIEVLES